MYNVVIADDERKVRNSIRNKGKWQELGLQIVAQAKDGDELCEILKTENVHVVITDLKMPGICEEKLLEYLGKNHPHLSVIVISGYDDYNYMKQAIQSKVCDYILKPINADVLNKTLEQIVTANRINAEKDERNRTLAFHKELMDESIFERLITGINVSSEEICRCIGTQTIEELTPIVVSVMMATNLKEVSQQTYNADVKMLLYGLLNIVNELISPNAKAIRIANDQLALVFYKKTDPIYVENILKNLIVQLKNYLSVEAIFGIGHAYDSWQDIIKSHKEAKSALAYMSLNTTHIQFWSEASNPIRLNENIDSAINLVKASLKNGDLALIEKSIDKFYSQISCSQYLSLRFIQEANNAILKVLKETFKESALRLSRKYDDLNERLKQENNIVNMAQEVHLFIRQNLKKDVEKLDNNIILAIKDYIDCNEKFFYSLDTICLEFGISKQYFIKKFREKFCISPYEYILGRKIECSKRLLIENDLTISEIAHGLNFSDSSHFSKSFKKYEGISPKEYKKNWIK